MRSAGMCVCVYVCVCGVRVCDNTSVPDTMSSARYLYQHACITVR